MRGGRARGGAVVAALAALLALSGPAAADPPPAGATAAEATFPSTDGTRLHAHVFRPAGLAPDARTPVVLVVSPYLGLPNGQFPLQGPPHIPRYYRRLYDTAIARGFTVAQVSFRGTAQSAGCADFGGPGERGDVRAAVAWAAAQPWSTGRVGMLGHSYDGFAAVVALAERVPELAGAVVIGGAADLYRGMYMNGVRYVQARGVTAYYQAFQLIPPAPSPRFPDPGCSAPLVAASQDPDPAAPFWTQRRIFESVAGSRVPVFWAHGLLDGRDDFSAVRPDNVLPVFERLAGPRRAWVGQFSHVVPGEPDTWNEPAPVGRAGFADEALDWLGAHVAGDAAAAARVAGQPAIAVQEGARGGWRAEPAWPPAGTTATMALRPGTYRDGAGTKAESGDGADGPCSDVRARCNPLSRTGEGAWTFSEPLAHEAHVSGVAQVRVELDDPPPGARVVALVYDVDPAGRASLLTRGASLVAGTRVAFDLYPQDWRLAPGHRVGVLLAGSDDFYIEPGTTGATVAVTGGALTLPLLAVPRPDDLPGGPSRDVAERTTFTVAPDGGAPPRREAAAAAPERLRVRVRPRRVRPGVRVRLRVAVETATGRRVRGALVRAGRRTARTGGRGVARIAVRLAPGVRLRVRATRPGFAPGRAWVRARTV